MFSHTHRFFIIIYTNFHSVLFRFLLIPHLLLLFSLTAQIHSRNRDSVSIFHVNSWSIFFLVYLPSLRFSTFPCPLSGFFLFRLSLPRINIIISFFSFTYSASYILILPVPFSSKSSISESRPYFFPFPFDLIIFPVFFHSNIFLQIFVVLTKLWFNNFISVALNFLSSSSIFSVILSWWAFDLIKRCVYHL